MARESDGFSQQLSFEFTIVAPIPYTSVDDRPQSVVVSFVDASTLAIRRDAIRRVRQSRIFDLSTAEKKAL